MATATKTARTLVAAGTTKTAGGADVTGKLDMTTALGGFLTFKVTNGATGPASPCSIDVQVSVDDTNYKNWFEGLQAGTANSQDYEWGIEIPAAVMYCQVVFRDNTTQNVTVEAFIHELTSIA